jgi:hypothetical protein
MLLVEWLDSFRDELHLTVRQVNLTLSIAFLSPKLVRAAVATRDEY